MVNQESSELSVLFMCDQGAVQAPLAEALANGLSQGEVSAWSAGVSRGTPDDRTDQVLTEIGISDPVETCRTLGDLADRAFDVVVTLTEGALAYCCDRDTGGGEDGAWSKSPLFVGAP